MEWNEKDEGGWGLHGPRGYCYPHYEPLEQRQPQWRLDRAEQIKSERERQGDGEGVGKMTKMRGKKIWRMKRGEKWRWEITLQATQVSLWALFFGFCMERVQKQEIWRKKILQTKKYASIFFFKVIHVMQTFHNCSFWNHSDGFGFLMAWIFLKSPVNAAFSPSSSDVSHSWQSFLMLQY